MRRSAILGALLMLSLSCGSSTPTQPANTTVSFYLLLVPVSATYSAQFRGQTFTASGSFQVTLPPGTYEISGTFQGTALAVSSAAVQGGIQSGSFRSLSGPSPEVRACTLTYFAPNAAQQSFRLQFVVTTNLGSACQGSF